MSPAAIDREFRSLSEEAGGSEGQLVSLFQALLQMLLSRQNYELGQAYLGLALKVRVPALPHSNLVQRLNCPHLIHYCPPPTSFPPYPLTSF